MNRERQATWEDRQRGAPPGEPEPSVIEMLPLMPPGLALDIAAGTGRNSIATARAGHPVVAVDFSRTGLKVLDEIARRDRLAISCVVADLEETFPFQPGAFDLILNVSYLDRGLVPLLKSALRPGGAILFDTFLIDETGAAGGGHLHNPRFTLDHHELRSLLGSLELVRYHEGLVVYPGGKRSWRATALARRGA